MNDETMEENATVTEAITEEMYNSTDDVSSEFSLEDNVEPIQQEFETNEPHIEVKDSFAGDCCMLQEETKAPAVATEEQMSQDPSLVKFTSEEPAILPYQFPRPSKESSNKNETSEETIQISDINDENNAEQFTKKAGQIAYEDMSIRQIKFLLKELSISKNNKNQDKQQQVEKVRTALQVIPDN